MITEYVRAYRDLSRMLARYCPPWSWVLGLADACRDLRQAVPVE